MPLTPVSLAKTPKEKVKESLRISDGPNAEDLEDYSYSLSIRLSFSELQKLGFGRGQLESGMMVNFIGSGLITSTNTEMINGLARHEASLQIQTLGVEPVEDGVSSGKIIYGGE